MLSRTGLLEDASADLINLIEDIAIRIKVPANTTMFSENDEGNALYIVQDGAVEISVIWEDGRKLGLEIMRSGSVFGEIALFDPGFRTATATTIDASTLYQVNHKDLVQAINLSPELSLDFLRLAGRRMRWMNKQLHEYVFLALPARLARKLLHLTSRAEGSAQDFNLSQSDLADFAGATREAVSKTLAVWKHQGIIETGRGKMAILDRTALRNIAGIGDLEA